MIAARLEEALALALVVAHFVAAAGAPALGPRLRQARVLASGTGSSGRRRLGPGTDWFGGGRGSAYRGAGLGAGAGTRSRCRPVIAAVGDRAGGRRHPLFAD